MSDQTTQIKYVGTARWPELAITGRQSAWMPGQIESRAPSEAAALLATGLFSSPPVPVLAETSPGGGVVNRRRGIVTELAGVRAGLSAGRDAEFATWVKPIHVPILDPAQYMGMTPVVQNGVTVSCVAGAGDFSPAAIRVAVSEGVTNKSALLPLAPRLEAGVRDQTIRAGGQVHLRLKITGGDWSKVNRLYVSLCQADGSTSRMIGTVIGDRTTRHGISSTTHAGAWAGYRTLSFASTDFAPTGTPTPWGRSAKHFEVTGIHFTLTTTEAVEILIDRIYSPEWPVGIVTPIFDGAYSSARSFVKEQFLPRGWGAGFSQNMVEAGGIYPTYADLKELSLLGFDVFCHGHDLDVAGTPTPTSATTTTPERYALVISQQRQALYTSGIDPSGMIFHQFLTDQSRHTGTDMAGILRKQGVLACRLPCSDAEWGIDPYEAVTAGYSASHCPTNLPHGGRYNRITAMSFGNIPQGGDYSHAGVNPASLTLRRRVEYAAMAKLPVCPYNHQIIDAPGLYDVSSQFAMDWVEHMAELERSGDLIIVNPSTLERLTFLAPGETYMRWDGEWVYRHDPTTIAF